MALNRRFIHVTWILLFARLGRYGMLRWGRWAAFHIVESRPAVLSGSKNVSRIVQSQRPFSLVPAVASNGHSTETKMTNEDNAITTTPSTRPNPVSSANPLLNLRALLNDKRPVDLYAIESAYVAARPHHLSYLTKSEFSSLVSTTSARPEFVLELCEDQIRLGRRVPDSDRYWYMLAHLNCCLSHFRALESNDNATEPKEAVPPAPMEHLRSAQVHYTKLAKNYLGVHHVYLEQLLRIYKHIPSTPTYSQMIVTLCDITSNVLKSLFSKPGFRFESQLSQVVWRIIASVQFDRAQARAILHTLRLRVSLQASARDSQTRTLDPIEHLRQAILDFSRADPRSNDEVYSILHDSQAWVWLRVLAGGSCKPSLVTGANTRLTILATLRQIDTATPLPGSEPPLTSLERCWDAWMTILGAEAASTHSPSADTVDRAILLSFLRLAARYQSTRVMSGSERLLTVYTSVLCEEDMIHMAQPGSLSVEFGAAYACTGTSNIFGLSARLSAAGFRSDSARLPPGYLAHMIELLLKYGSPQAAWKVSSQITAELPATLIASVAHSCAKAGYVSEAASLLYYTRLDIEERHRIAFECLYQLNKQRGVLTRPDALNVCEALGPDLARTPQNLRPIAVRMALNAGLLRLAGHMGTHWQLQPRLQRLLATRLVKARLPRLALQVVGLHQTEWLSMLLNNSCYHQKFPGRVRPSHNRLSYGKINATRLGNILLVRSGARLGGRAQLRATLATLARLLRANVAAHESSWISKRKRASFRPDGATLNIIVRALVRSTFCVSSNDLRTLFDLLSRTGRCGMAATGNHFGTGADYTLGGYASSAIALAKLVPPTEGPWAFVRYVRPLLRTFVTGLQVRRDQEGVKVVTRVLKTEDSHWRRAGWRRPGPDS
ncbi:unnamed protein product [Rhizoctonia solani]|uniref:Uncharacterized protein n=1 Tax=Rhizoctonia solani TaxID=456999 RepID=A0A8H2WWL5_9AGAM|nr:unnamed protein product [Rhizoctonia solani]